MFSRNLQIQSGLHVTLLELCVSNAVSMLLSATNPLLLNGTSTLLHNFATPALALLPRLLGKHLAVSAVSAVLPANPNMQRTANSLSLHRSGAHVHRALHTSSVAKAAVAQPIAQQHTGRASYGQRSNISPLQEAAAVLPKHIRQQQQRQLRTTAASAASYLALETADRLFSTEGCDLFLGASNKTLSELDKLLSRANRKQAAAGRKLAEDVDQRTMFHLVQVSAVLAAWPMLENSFGNWQPGRRMAIAALQAYPLSACQ
jgi:hypothetical protein